ncbi:MAG: hypothetical protein ACNA8N_09120 [Trueperaceae bacterium]
MLGPTDLYVCLYLSTRTDEPGFARVAKELGVGIGTAHRAVGRLLASGLVLPTRAVQRRALLDLLVHAARHVYYVEPGGLTRGVRTAEAAPPLAAVIAPTDPPPVWPDPLGDTRGYAIEPLHGSVPRVAQRDPELYALLALVDALRIGQARVRSLAAAELRERLTA